MNFAGLAMIGASMLAGARSEHEGEFLHLFDRIYKIHTNRSVALTCQKKFELLILATELLGRLGAELPYVLVDGGPSPQVGPKGARLMHSRAEQIVDEMKRKYTEEGCGWR